jgi:hypothetical protein
MCQVSKDLVEALRRYALPFEKYKDTSILAKGEIIKFQKMSICTIFCTLNTILLAILNFKNIGYGLYRYLM